MANTDLTKVDQTQENVLKAMEIVSKAQLESLQFDRTIEATIIEDKESAKGIYTVSTGATNFLAYSNGTSYKKKDVVMVTIPQGNYDNQKIIIGKKVKQDNEPAFNYQHPFEQLVNITNNIINFEDAKEFRANDNNYGWDENQSDFLQSEAFKNNNEPKPAKINEQIFSENQYSDFTKIGIKADFSTSLKEYGTAYGNYGLAAILYFYNPDYSEDHIVTRIINLDSSQFFGDIYNFKTYQTEEAVFDISELEKFSLIKVEFYAYQRNNFKKVNRDPIYTISENTNIPNNIYIKNISLCLGISSDTFETDSVRILSDNISTYSKEYEKLINSLKKEIDSLEKIKSNTSNENFLNIKNQYINILKKYKDFLNNFIINNNITYPMFIKRIENTTSPNQFLMTVASSNFEVFLLTQYKNKKILNLRWIHQNEDTKFIKTIEQDEIPVNHEIRWYRYNIGASSDDDFVGANWERFYGCNESPDENGSYCIKNSDNDIVTNHIENVIFYPNLSKQNERLKALVVKKRNISLGDTNLEYELIGESQIIEFTNNYEVVNKATLISTNALSIRFDDAEKGNYFLYDRAGNVSKDESSQIRTLTAVFDDGSPQETNIYNKKELDTPYDYIKWSFPASNTMIIPAIINGDTIKQITTRDFDNGSYNGSTLGTYYSYYYTQNNSNDTFDFVYSPNSNDQKSDFVSIGFYINNTLDHSANRNTVGLEVRKEGITYVASVTMRFGTAGTSGSDYTIVVDWDNGENAFDVNKGELTGRIRLLDQAGNEVNLDDFYQSDSEKPYYTVSWDKYRINKDNSEIQPDHVIETRDLYYPIITENSENPNEENTFLKRIAYYWFRDSNNKKCYDFDLWNGENIYFVDYEPKYWVKNKTTNNAAEYNLENKTFKKCSYNQSNDKNKIRYRKLEKSTQEDSDYINYNNNIGRYKIDFKKIDKVFSSKQEFKNEEIFKSSFKTDNIWDNSIKCLFQYKEKFYYNYNNQRKVFIKYNDTYIIDPWDEYQEGETYYYPVYSKEKRYNSNQALYFKNFNEENETSYSNENLNLTNNVFTITDTINQNQLHQYQPNINTDLYILKIELKDFGDYEVLSACFPIALKNSDIQHDNPYFVVDYIEGASQVRYSTDGLVDFKKTPYLINFRVLKDATTYKSETQDSNVLVDETNNKYAQLGHWELIYDNSNDLDFTYLPSLVEVSNKKMTDYAVDILKNAFLTKIKNSNAKYPLLTLIEGFPSDEDPNNTYVLTYNNSGVETSVSNLSEENDKLDILIECLKYHNEKRKTDGDYRRSFSNAWSLKSYSGIINSETLTLLEDIIINDDKTNQTNLINFIDLLKNSKGMNYSGELPLDLFTRPMLNPPGIYFSNNDSDGTPLYGVRYVIDQSIIDNTIDNQNPLIKAGTTLWSQPIYAYQDNYPSTTLNKWNGKDIITDKDTGIVSANGFSAGKKEDDNTFTGVVIGDWSRTDSDSMITKQTGIYGFNHGAMSYALKDDGTAFFGKDGKGRIYFDGENAQIYSAKWRLPNEDQSFWNKQGMMLDIDDGILQLKGKNIETYLAPGEFRISGPSEYNNSNTINIVEIKINEEDNNDKLKYFLRSANYKKQTGIGDYTQFGSGLQIDLVNGNIEGYRTKIDLAHPFGSPINSARHLILSSKESDSYAIQVKNNTDNSDLFHVDWGGNIYSNQNIECLLLKTNTIKIENRTFETLYVTGLKGRDSSATYNGYILINQT